MTVISRGAVAAPVLPKRTVEVPELGGEVVVRGLLLRDRLTLLASPEVRDFGRVTRMLAATVLADDGEPLWTEAEWDEFGAAHSDACLRLFDVAMELSGLKAEPLEKN